MTRLKGDSIPYEKLMQPQRIVKCFGVLLKARRSAWNQAD